VLITGESGSGKEVVARAIHSGSAASTEPFVAVNIGGLHGDLAESELFGYEKGAFTGADARKPGLFELAGRGTIFLDEIGEMPLNLQVKLLRVLQDHRIRRLGGTRDLPVDVRVLSATNRDIEAAVAEGRFREDLYYRLNVVRLRVPPLRERTEDIHSISDFILAKIGTRMGRTPKELDASALERLRAYRFPGNIRELENILERATIYVDGDRIEAADLDLPLDAGPVPKAPAKQQEGKVAESSLGALPGETRTESMAEIEREAIRKALERSGGNRTKAASELGISRRTILNKIAQYGL
jgi:two-component system response regulator AtoC